MTDQVTTKGGSKGCGPNQGPDANRDLRSDKLRAKGWTIEEYRQSLAPIPVEIPVIVYIYSEHRKPRYEESKTTSVGTRGALVLFDTTADIGETVLLINSNNQKDVLCHIRLLGKNEIGQNLVGVEFATESRDFWGGDIPIKVEDPTRGVMPVMPSDPSPSLSSATSDSSKNIAEIHACINACTKVGLPATQLAAFSSADEGPSNSGGLEIVPNSASEYRRGKELEIPTPTPDFQRPISNDSPNAVAEIRECISAYAKEISQGQGTPSRLIPEGWRLFIQPMLFVTVVIALVISAITLSHKFTDGSKSTSSLDAQAATNDTWISAAKSMSLKDSGLISDADNYRLATGGDFDHDGVLWLRTFGQEMSGQIPGTYSTSGPSYAYVLVGKDNERRVVIVANGQLRCDAKYRDVAIAARVPKEVVGQIHWTEPLSSEPQGDGLLIVMDANNAGSGVVLFLGGDQIISATPANFHQIPLGETP